MLAILFSSHKKQCSRLFRHLCIMMHCTEYDKRNTGVNANVVLVVCGTGKCLAASRHLTRERTFTGVGADVNFTNVRRRKWSATSRVLTHKWLFSCIMSPLQYSILQSEEILYIFFKQCYLCKGLFESLISPNLIQSHLNWPHFTWTKCTVWWQL